VALCEVTYSTKPASDEELSYSDVVLVEAQTHEELTEKVVDIIRRLDPPGNCHVDSIGGDPYEPRPERRIAKKVAKSLRKLVRTINALILTRNQGS